MASYVQKTTKALRDCGWSYWVVEYYNPWAKIRVDMFHFADLIAIAPDSIVALQITGPSGHAKHKRDILANEYAPKWLKAGGRIMLRSWRKLVVKRGHPARRWTERIEEITLDMFTHPQQ